MPRELIVTHETWPLATPFRISRGTKVAADVVVVEIRENGLRGRGEAVPYPRYDETTASVTHEIERVRSEVERGISKQDLIDTLRAGAARNAIDCALWDLEARASRTSVETTLNERPLPALVTALTVVIDTPENMAAAAARIAATAATAALINPSIKVKVDGINPAAQLRAVRAAAPKARLIVDPNESWTLQILEAMQSVMTEARVDVIEQPLPAAEDAVLEGYRSATPICADESCHTAEDLPTLRRRYQAVNIKLDKSGGLTGALALLKEAKAQGFGIMAGCMVCTSLGIAPAFHIGRHADFVDLDGPLWLARDHAGGVRLEEGRLRAPGPELWGGALGGQAEGQP